MNGDKSQVSKVYAQKIWEKFDHWVTGNDDLKSGKKYVICKISRGVYNGAHKMSNIWPFEKKT